ncbi:MAG TPA: CocE/NonD family hydrolase [Chloroflexia bacterium]|nr:CocE/NonD family hydrolase [Chloroflexia bacterium]
MPGANQVFTNNPLKMKNEKPGPAYIARRIKNLLFPPVRLLPWPSDIIVEQNAGITVRDGTVLRANIFRPAKEGQYPVIMSAHPYGKDNYNRKGRLGVRPFFQYRIINQPMPINTSERASWEAPDPAFWVPKGYVVINLDLRGFFASPGEGEVLSDQEAQDYYDCIEWAASQPWSNGKVGLNGVSYLAISQYKVAALHPPHLAAICPWEGFTDAYKDLLYPGGIREDGFAKMWGNMVHSKTNIRTEQMNRPLRDEYYRSLVPNLKKISVPALICGSFSDQCLHSQGSIRAFNEISSPQKWLYTHRLGKWGAYYGQDALAIQRKFFDHFLKGEANGMPEMPPVRLEVMESGQQAHRIAWEAAFPPPGTTWRTLYLDGKSGQLSEDLPQPTGQAFFEMEKGRACFEWVAEKDLEVVGPMVLKLFVELKEASDLNLFAGIRKIRDGRQVVFEGSYGFGYDLVTRGWQRVSLRKVTPGSERPGYVEHDFDQEEPLKPGEIVELALSLLPSATFFKKGDVLRLDLQGHWFFGSNVLIYGPAKYEGSSGGTCIVYSGEKYPSQLQIPISATS